MIDLPYAPLSASHSRMSLGGLGYRPRTVSIGVLVALLRGFDGLLAVAAAVAVTPPELRHGDPAGGMYLAASLAAFAVAAFGARYLGIYRVRLLRSLSRQAVRWAAILGGAGAAAALVLAMLGAPLGVMAEWPVAWAALGVLLIMGARLVVTPTFQAGLANGALTRRVAVIGANPLGHAIVAAIAADPDARQSLVGIFDEPWNDNTWNDKAWLAGRDVVGKVADLADLSRRERVDAIVIAHTDPARIERVCGQLRSVIAEVALATTLPATAGRTPRSSEFESSRLGPVSRLGDITLLTILPRALTDWETMQKAVFDHVVGAALLVVLSPVLALIALAIRLDSPGPVFFRQPRLGYNNVPFRMVKFRTMHHAMTDLLADRQTSRDDVRVTKVGRVLRSLSLDELPQLLNVIRGEMSIVGPRPHAPNTRAGDHKLDEAVAEYAERHRVKPGITGWAQVNGSRGELRSVDHIRKRVEYDLDYIQNWSLWLDISILFLTIRKEIFSSRAF